MEKVPFDDEALDFGVGRELMAEEGRESSEIRHKRRKESCELEQKAGRREEDDSFVSQARKVAKKKLEHSQALTVGYPGPVASKLKSSGATLGERRRRRAEVSEGRKEGGRRRLDFFHSLQKLLLRLNGVFGSPGVVLLLSRYLEQ